MAVETERKFLVNGDDWRELATPRVMKQGYLSDDKRLAVRVRIAGDSAYLTVKGAKSGLSRLEYEYPIPVADADELLDTLCQRPLIEKIRHTLIHQGTEWVVDEFLGENEGLIVAEVELDSEDQQVPLPGWAGQEVTDDTRYLNVNLVKHPFSQWSRD
ncbi:MAG: CYTH domain-containing protein [Rhodospirillales bacterium]|nr:CYTH domain-containing protein [Rhodospirillales bacterium]